MNIEINFVFFKKKFSRLSRMFLFNLKKCTPLVMCEKSLNYQLVAVKIINVVSWMIHNFSLSTHINYVQYDFKVDVISFVIINLTLSRIFFKCQVQWQSHCSHYLAHTIINYGIKYWVMQNYNFPSFAYMNGISLR